MQTQARVRESGLGAGAHLARRAGIQNGEGGERHDLHGSSSAARCALPEPACPEAMIGI